MRFLRDKRSNETNARCHVELFVSPLLAAAIAVLPIRWSTPRPTLPHQFSCPLNISDALFSLREISTCHRAELMVPYCGCKSEMTIAISPRNLPESIISLRGVC